MSDAVVPMLSVRRGPQAVEFYKTAFGATELFKMESPDGQVIAELSVGSTRFWVSDESPDNANFSPETLGGGTVRLLLISDDPDAVFDRAVAAGAKVVWPVANQRYGWRVGRVADPYGHHWEICKQL